MLNYQNTVVKCVTDFKYRGVFIDQHLIFEQHWNYVRKKVDQCTGPLWRVQSFISKDLALHLYKSSIHPHFIYCSYVCDICSPTNSTALQVAQNNALQAVLNADSRHPTDTLHQSLEIDWLDVAHMESTGIKTFKALNGLIPEPIILCVYVT